jgi:uroporphyrinogen-III decarboxylase
MLPKEVVYRAIGFRNPPRIPLNYCNRDTELSDTRGVGFHTAAGFKPVQPGETEWGYVWDSLDNTMGQPLQRPITSNDKLASYIPPSPTTPGRLDHLKDDISQISDCFIKFGIGISGFNQATFLRGFEDFLMDLYTDRNAAERVLDIVFNFENGMIERLADYEVDSVAFGDDWGTQQGLMISHELWQDAFRRRYAEQFQLVHDMGKKVWFHTCGNVYSIIGDLIDIGVDVIELLQPDIFGIDKLAREFGGKVCFCCSVDHQRVAISGNKEEIFAYVQKLIDKLGAYNGGFIGYIEDYSCLGMSEQNYQCIKEAFCRFAR